MRRDLSSDPVPAVRAARAAMAVAVTLLATACGASEGDDGGDEPAGPGRSEPTVGSTSPSPLSVTLVDCDTLITAVNSDVVPMLVSDRVAVDDLELTRDTDNQRGCDATNALGDELAVLELDLDPADEGCVGGEQEVPEAGRGSYACATTFRGSQSLVAAVDVAGRPESVNVLLELATPRYRDADVVPVAVTLTRTAFELLED